ncbi:MAG: hypothetical protein CL489_08770 [Acidobacteria bacterium]|nr:hypothetical protein [Acidobacteriota bacterium]|tara:strand:- start:11793 stop:12077 length:285 start_codon:yes stop_codon:yes gene_type:complete
MKTEVVVETFPLTNAKKQQISLEIECIKETYDEYTYIESVLEWCDVNDVDVTEIKKYINETLIRKIEVEAKDANLIKNKDTAKSKKDDQWLFGV